MVLCRKRRLSDDVYAYLQSLGIDVEPSQAGADDKLSCPETLAALRSVFGSWDDISNRYIAVHMLLTFAWMHASTSWRYG